MIHKESKKSGGIKKMVKPKISKTFRSSEKFMAMIMAIAEKRSQSFNAVCIEAFLEWGHANYEKSLKGLAVMKKHGLTEDEIGISSESLERDKDLFKGLEKEYLLHKKGK